MRSFSILLLAFALLPFTTASAASSPPASPAPSRDRDIAAAIAPVFVQGLGESARFDYITRFNFDGDWRGDNNWANASKTEYTLSGYVYYDVKETDTHVFVHYACFHPRDYKGGSTKGVILSNLIQAGNEKYGKYDPTGKADEAILAHENDLEGCLVVAKKKGAGATDLNVVFVETLAHNKFLKYVPGAPKDKDVTQVPMEGEHPILFVEPKGHGIEASSGSADATKSAVTSLLTYRYSGSAEDPDRRSKDAVGYALEPLADTLWVKAKGSPNDTYGDKHDYGAMSVQEFGSRGSRKASIGVLGSAFNGKEGGVNMARPPWGWFDDREKQQPLGGWFFDPAGTIKRHFTTGSKFSTAYTQNLALGISARGSAGR